jgi:hypothetical protein
VLRIAPLHLAHAIAAQTYRDTKAMARAKSQRSNQMTIRLRSNSQVENKFQETLRNQIIALIFATT